MPHMKNDRPNAQSLSASSLLLLDQRHQVRLGRGPLHRRDADLDRARVVRVDGVDPDLEGVAAGALLQRVAAVDEAAGAQVVQHAALQTLLSQGRIRKTLMK